MVVLVVLSELKTKLQLPMYYTLSTAIVIYVDDLIISRDDQGSIFATKQKLHAQFDMIDLGLLHFFLGLEIWQHSQGIFVSQERYV